MIIVGSTFVNVTYTNCVHYSVQLYQFHAYVLCKCVAEGEITKYRSITLMDKRRPRYFFELKGIVIMEEFRRLYPSFSATQNAPNAICLNKNARTVQEILSSYYARECPRRIHYDELLKHFVNFATDRFYRKKNAFFLFIIYY